VIYAGKEAGKAGKEAGKAGKEAKKAGKEGKEAKGLKPKAIEALVPKKMKKDPKDAKTDPDLDIDIDPETLEAIEEILDAKFDAAEKLLMAKEKILEVKLDLLEAKLKESGGLPELAKGPLKAKGAKANSEIESLKGKGMYSWIMYAGISVSTTHLH
jgi:hypothetical protein